ncbi:MAG: sugar ABC transporter substrate-binding protein [Chloroflexi bacterium]|nr:sugar ABC transporter substrate-binding protein [Chloroflexota bacterium]
MATSLFTRRRLLQVAGLAGLAAPLLAACGAPAASPTAAPAKPAESKPAAGATPAATQAAAAAPASGAKVPMKIAVWTIVGRPWQEERATKYKQDNAGKVDLTIEQINYDDMAKKQLAMIATNTVPDVLYSGVKWYHYSAFKGVFYPLDDLLKADDPGMSDFFKAAIEGVTRDGKIYGLPFEVNSGNQNIYMFNKDLMEQKGVKPPTDDWTLDEFTKMAVALTDPAKKIFGTNPLHGTYYDFDTVVRTFGGELLPEGGKKFALTTDPKAVEAMRWLVDLRVKHKAAPNRAETEGLDFVAGRVGMAAVGVQSIVTLQKQIGDKFKWDVVLAPKGPTGLRGYEAFVTIYSMGSKTAAPKEAYDLLKFMTNKDTASYAFLEQGQPPARVSVWQSPEAAKINTIWGRAAAWMTDGKNQGPFPMPDNLRFSEFQDKWANLSTPLVYGEVGFDEGMKKLQDECSAIMAQPRG